jgi:hypothetical protein
MSKMMEYLGASIGYDSDGLPASTVQFTFGFSPFQIASTENIADVTNISTICQCDAVVDIKIIDDTAMVSFDFSNETPTLVEFVQELEGYTAQRSHVTESLNNILAQIAVAEKNEDQNELESLQGQLRSMSIPFMLPTILPIEYGGSVKVGFADDPKFVFLTSDNLNQMPSKVTMIFDAHDIFCEDEIAIYTEDTEAEIRAQQEELWYMEEAKKLEEEQYQAQFGYGANDYDYDEAPTDKRLKGVRFK